MWIVGLFVVVFGVFGVVVVKWSCGRFERYCVDFGIVECVFVIVWKLLCCVVWFVVEIGEYCYW